MRVVKLPAVCGVYVPGGTTHPSGIYLHGRQVLRLLLAAKASGAGERALRGMIEALERDESTPVVTWPA